MIGFVAANNAQTFYLDGAADGTAALETTHAGLTNEWNSIGTGFNVLDVFSGDVAEALVYTRSLTPTEVGKLHTYFSGRYGTP